MGKKEYMACSQLSIAICHEILKAAYLNVTNAQFVEAIDSFRKILHVIPLLVISTSDELRDARNLIKTSREYINALRTKQESRVHKDSLNLIAISLILSCRMPTFLVGCTAP